MGIKREYSATPRIERRGGGGRGSQQPQGRSENNNQSKQLPDWVFMSNLQIQLYFQCSEDELRLIRFHLKDYQERHDYDGRSYPTTWAEDMDGTHFRALWARMTEHSDEFRDMLTGSRWDEDEKPRDLPTKLEECKKKLCLPWKASAAKARKAEEKKLAEDEKEERREARKEKKRRARRAARARESSQEAEDRLYPSYSRSPTLDHEQRVYPAYGRTSQTPGYLEEGICPPFFGIEEVKPRIWAGNGEVIDLTESEDRKPMIVKSIGEVMDLDEIEDIKPFFEQIRITEGIGETIDLDDIEDIKPFFDDIRITEGIGETIVLDDFED